MSNWSALIPEAPFDWALIPLDGRKRPIDHITGEVLSEWQQQPGYDVEGISALNGKVQAVGLMLGEKSGGVLQVDFDGPKSPAKFQEVFGQSPQDLPKTIGVTSGKASRGSRFFLVDQDWWPSLRGRKVWKDDDGEICLELRWTGHQAVIAGKHPETKGYRWLSNSAPSDLEMAKAPDWLLEPLVRTESTYEPVAPTADDADRAIAMLQCIDPEERDDYDSWLEIGMALHHTDKGLLSKWVDWSSQMANFNEQECLDKWQGFADYKGVPLTIGSLHHYAKQGGYKEPKRKKPEAQPQTSTELSPTTDGNVDPHDYLADWERYLERLVDPNDDRFERNTIRRQIRAATSAAELNLRVSPIQVRSRLIQKQRSLLKKTEEKGVSGGQIASFADQVWLINNLISADCLTSIAAFVKVGKTKCLTELVSSLIFQHPFMGNPEWMPSPEKHKFILWWTDQPGVNSAQYLKARGLMDAGGRLHPQIVRLYTSEDNLCWDDEGMDELIEITSKHPGAILVSDSFYANVRPVHGSDQEPESGGALIDIQTYCADKTQAHICAFHSPQNTDKLGMEAIRGHGSAKGVPSAGMSLHFIEKKDPRTGRWLPDKEAPYRRLVIEGRMPYQDLLVGFEGAAGTWNVIGKFEQSMAELQTTEGRAETISALTDKQRETLEWVGSAAGIWKCPHGVTVRQVAACKIQHLNREPNESEIEGTRKQLRVCVKGQLLHENRVGREFYYSYKGDG